MKKFLKKAYKTIPYKQQVYSGLKHIWRPDEAIYKHLHFSGKFRVKVDKDHSFWINHYGYQIENEIFWAGLENGWEKESFKLWIELCRHAETIVDVGANTGIYALIAESLNPQATVYAFEPVERVFNKLEENVQLNQFQTVCIQKALSNFDGTAKIYDTGNEHVYSVTVNKNLTPNSQTTSTEIQTITLDTFIEQNKIEKIDLMKIDVVLEGFQRYLSAFQPDLLIEILSDEVGEKVQKWIDSMDYVFYNIDERTGLKKVAEIKKSDFFNYLICKPQTATYLNLD